MTSPWKRPINDDLRMPSSRCPSCGQELDGATDTVRDVRRPQPGDILICVYCAAVNKLGEDMMLEPVAGDELILMLADPDVKEAVAAVRKVMALRK